jgi:hypothetical protein
MTPNQEDLLQVHGSGSPSSPSFKEKGAGGHTAVTVPQNPLCPAGLGFHPQPSHVCAQASLGLGLQPFAGILGRSTSPQLPLRVLPALAFFQNKGGTWEVDKCLRPLGCWMRPF